MARLPLIAIAMGVALATAACTNASAEAPQGGSTQPAASTASADAVRASEAVTKLVPEAVKAKGELTFAMDASYAPFEYFDTDNTTIIGFDADLSKALAAKMGLTAKDVNTGFDTILVGLTSGKHDVGMSAFSATAERAKTVDFVVYGAGGSGIAVKTGNPKGLTMDPAKFCGHTISAQKGSLQGIDFLPKFSKQCTDAGKPAITIALYPSQNEANLAVASGRADAVLADSVSMAYQAQQSKGAFELAPGPDFDPTNIAVALPNDSPLVPAISEALKELDKDGVVATLAAKWGIPEQVIKQAKIGEVVR
ncbi:MAG TPA: ABC transporter substrate-binding protein [Intrasporangium sp.]|nr:ABC transporter substrate-binding protein [Intrasporangium sp.]